MDKVKKAEYDRKYYLANRERHRENSRRYYLSNLEKVKEAHRKWTYANPGKSAERWNKWKLADPEKAKEIRCNWQLANPEKLREYARKWRLANPEKHREEVARRKAKKLSASGNGITTAQARQLFEEYNYHCAYCGSTKNLTIDHIVPLSRGGAHDISNAVPSCKSCNSRKNGKTLLIWLYDRRMRVEES